MVDRYPNLKASTEKVDKLIKRIGKPGPGRTYCAILIDIQEVNALQNTLELAKLALIPKRKL